MMRAIIVAAVIALPPKHTPPFDGQVIVVPDAATFCGRPDAWGCASLLWTADEQGRTSYACVIHTLPIGTVMKRQVLNAKSHARLIEHEKAHCSGWTHERARL